MPESRLLSPVRRSKSPKDDEPAPPADADAAQAADAAPATAVRLVERTPRPRATAALALAGLLALTAVPGSIYTTATSQRSAAPLGRAVTDAARSDSAGNPANVVVPRSRDADGSDLTEQVAVDPALRRTLLALRSQAKARLAQGVNAPAHGEAPIVVGGSVADIPGIAIAAYRRSAIGAGAANPGCHVPWSLLAGIGRVESDHGQNGGSRPAADGVVHPSILGPVLNGGAGNAAIADTDGGRYDGDPRWDRAVGPMQFIPSTWAASGRDGNGDGVSDPENLFDAALAAADYLCASGGDLRTTSAAERAVLSYNHSWDYVLVVLGYAGSYAGQDVSAITADIAKYLDALPNAALTKALKLPVKKKVVRPAKPKARSAPPAKPTPAVASIPGVPSPPTPAPLPTPTSVPTTAPTVTPAPTPTPALPPAPPVTTPAPAPPPTTVPPTDPAPPPTTVPPTDPVPAPPTDPVPPVVPPLVVGSLPPTTPPAAP